MTTLSRVFALLFIALLATPVSAKEFFVTKVSATENASGNRIASDLTKSLDEVIYEIIPATAEVNERLNMTGCSAFVIDGSVLSSMVEIDHENRREGAETIKVLVRSVACRIVIRQ